MIINVKESTLITPAEETPKRSLWLSNLDLVAPERHAPFLWYHKPNHSSNFFDAGVLKEALSKALVPFYPIAGRLTRKEDGRVELDCDGQGVLFMVAQTESIMDDFVDRAPTLELNQLIPAVNRSGDISSNPILVLQVTHFRCGGVSLGVGVDHHVVDGISFHHFMNTWSDMARGHDITLVPIIDRILLCARNPPKPIFEHIEYLPPPCLKTKNSLSTIPSEETAVAIFKITRDQLNTLKTMSNEGGNTIKCTSFEILAAHVWRCACMARSFPNNQETKMYIQVNGRHRLCPTLPPGYFGNAVFTASIVAMSNDLTCKPIAYAATVIHDALEHMDNEYLRSAIDYLELNPLTPVLNPQTFGIPNIRIVSWNRLPIYDTDFGWGQPIFFGRGALIHEGHVYVLPNAASDGSLSFSIVLQSKHMKLFTKIVYDTITKASIQSIL